MEQWIQVITTLAAVIVMLFGFARWFMDWAEKRDAEQEERFEKALDEQEKDVEKAVERTDACVKELNATREKMIQEYVRHDDIKSFREEMREDFKSLYTKIGGIDRAVNQLIGIVRGDSRHE